MAEKWAPKLGYGFEEPLTMVELEDPIPPFSIDDDAEGGYDKAASGIPEAYEIRRDYIRGVRIRFRESQYSEVEAAIRWAQTSGEAFSFWFDGADDATRVEVYLDEPTLLDGFRPIRNRYSGLFEFDMKIRSEDGLPITVNWSGE